MKEEYTNQHRRQYDKDPVLSQAVKTLEETDDETQIRIALNLIKIIIEHNIEDEKFEAVEDIINAVGSGLDDNRKGRWYDIDSTLRTAMNMLQNCPAATQQIIAKEMAKMVVDSIKKEEEIDDEEQFYKEISRKSVVCEFNFCKVLENELCTSVNPRQRKIV